MTGVAALSGPLPKAGVIVLAGLVAAALLAGDRRPRAVAMIAALVLAPVLLLAEIWQSPQLAVVHRDPAVAAVGALVAIAVLAALAWLLGRRQWLVAPLVVATLPFRIPIQSGGTTSNLLVPLYAVVAAGVLAYAFEVWRLRRDERAADSGDGVGGLGPAKVDPGDGVGGLGSAKVDPGDNVGGLASGAADHHPLAPATTAPRAVTWLARLLGLYVLLYAVQAAYSTDFEKALQQMVFFYAPFGLMFCQLRELPWNQALLRICLEVVAALAVVFALIGFVEYATKTIVLNPALVVQNDLHTYFTVNSVFFDPNIFGRFLALVMITLVAALLYARRRGQQLIVTVVLVVLWAGLVLTLSRSSLGALLAGLGPLAALRWRPSRAVVAAAAVVVVGALVVVLAPRIFGLNEGLNGASNGRAGLVSGGLRLFSERPVWGYGSGSFVVQYRREQPDSQTVAASHTIAVTIAAEQGIIGETVYVALVLVALLALLPRTRGDPGRAAIAAAFVALVVHTNLYADFLEDPLTWTLLGVGAALACLPAPARVAPAPAEAAVARVAAPVF